MCDPPATALPIHTWLDKAHDVYNNSLENEVIVVSLIGKDLIDRYKGDEFNDYLKMDVFSPFRDENGATVEIEVYYSCDDRLVFLVMHGESDFTHMQNVFEDSPDKNFFEVMRESSALHLRLLHFICIVSHIVVFVEPVTRFELPTARNLRNVNKLRLSNREYLCDSLSAVFHDKDAEEQDSVAKFWSHKGRLSTPRFLFGFHKNVIKNELGNVKRREIYAKLENALEDQISSVLKYCKVVDCANSSLGYLPEKGKEAFVHLILPVITNANPLADLVHMHDEGVCLEDRSSLSSSFSTFLWKNIKSVREKLRNSQSTALPSLGTWIDGCEVAYHQLVSECRDPSAADHLANAAFHFQEELLETSIESALSQYSRGYGGKERDRTVFTKAEHDHRFAAAVSYLENVLIGNRDVAMARLRAACDKLWQGGMQGCEQQSVTGNHCQLPVHGVIGDVSVAENEWRLHTNNITYISTCTCGRSQALRNDPFSVKEANYDFYQRSDFLCCRNLERHQFAVLDDSKYGAEVLQEIDEHMWAGSGDENWPRVGVEGNHLRLKAEGQWMLDGADSEEGSDSDPEDAKDLRSYSTDDRSSQSEEDEESRSRLERQRGTDRQQEERKAAIEYAKRLKLLKQDKVEFLEGVPHSLSTNLVPIFPSWTLTCLGPSSTYFHTIGLRDQPNFKIACEYLLPVDVNLQVDPDQWDADMEVVCATIAGSLYPRRRHRRPAEEVERVKLFVGFDYECPRGHRFFVGADGEPLVLPKGIGREAVLRECASGILASDLPLRRKCTCKKLPHQVAQLMKIHIVTPKAPVNITLQPQIQLPDREGYFGTGESPLNLGWARYYILQLPFVYSSGSDTWVPPMTFERSGVFKGGAIGVSYTPFRGY